MSTEIKATDSKTENSKSFDGKHEIQFNEKSHRYKLDGKAVVGTTTFCKSGYPTSVGLINWMKAEAMKSLFAALSQKAGSHCAYVPNTSAWPLSQEKLDELLRFHRDSHEAVAREAADIGTICHAYAELHSLGKKNEAEMLLDKVRSAEKWPVIMSCVSKYERWDQQNKGELVLAEALIASPTNLFCGKFDRLDRVNGRLILRDYKTSKSIYPENFIQLGAYSLAIKEWLNLEVQGLEVLRFGKDDGEFETLLIDNPEEMKMFRDQAMVCLQTHRFRKIEADPRFNWKKKK